MPHRFSASQKRQACLHPWASAMLLNIALSQLVTVTDTRLALGSGGSLSSALHSVQLADLLGETRGPAPPPSAFAELATALTAPCTAVSAALVDVPLAHRLGSLGACFTSCSASNVQRGDPCQACVCRLLMAAPVQRCTPTVLCRTFTLQQNNICSAGLGVLSCSW